MKKRFVAFLLVLIMVLGMLPVSAMAAGSVVTARGSAENPIRIYENSGNQAETSYGSVQVPVGETVTDSGQLTFSTYSAIEGVQVSTGGFTYCNVTSSNENVVKATGSWSGGVLTINFQGVGNGTAKITVDYTCTCSKGAAANGYLIYNVTVGDGGTTDPSGKPNAPTASDIGAFPDAGKAVLLHCVDAGARGHDATASSLNKVQNGYSVGEVVENPGTYYNVDGGKITKEQFPWMCVVTVHAAPFIELYNSNFSESKGVHKLAGTSNATATLHWFWHNTYGWQYLENPPIQFNITKDTSEKTYTLTYYKNTTDTVTNMPDPNPQTETSNTGKVTFPISNARPVREGYNFLGWAGKQDATEPSVKPGNTVTTTATTTKLYAVWQSNTPPTDKPAKPTENDVTGVVVDIVCVTKTGTHDTVQYQLGFATTPQHTIGEVASDGAGGYICPVTVRTAWFVQQASNLVWKVQHTPTAQTITFNLTYDKNSKTWVKPAANPRIEATHEVTPPTKPIITGRQEYIRVICKNEPNKERNYVPKFGRYTESDPAVQKVNGVWTYTITILRDKHVEEFNKDFPGHEDTDPNAVTTMSWVWKDAEWKLVPVNGLRTVGAIIEVICEPKAPTADELKKLEMAVQVKCVVDASQQHKDAYGLLGECDVDYFVGEPKKVGDDWLCDISYDPDPYVAEFNKAFPTPKHIQNDEKIVPVTLIWVGGSWQIKTQGRVLVTEVYTVTFDSYGGTPVPPKQEVEYGHTATKPADPTLKGYTFAFWYRGEDEQNAPAYDFNTPVTENITLTAKWNINKYTVTFDSYGGTPVPPVQEVEYGLTATKPADPTLKGYTFAFWYLGEDEQNATAYDFDTPVTENITLTAKWNINKYTVAFNTDGGTPVPPAQEVEYGLTATEPAAPEKTGYTFDGWYLGDEKYDFSAAVEQNITLTAKWMQNTYTVTFDPNGGNELAEADKTKVVKIGEAYGELPTPTRKGYNFAGWYTEAEEGTVVTADTTVSAMTDHTLYAHWEAKKANVHIMIFKSNDLGTPIVDRAYTTDAVYGDTLDLAEIDPSSYLDFDFEIDGGWYDDGLFNLYKKYVSGEQANKPAALTKLQITGNWQNLKLIVTELVPVVYFKSAEALAEYQNDHSKVENIIFTTKARVGSTLPTADAPTATRDGYTFTFWSREGQIGTDVTGQTVNGWTNLVANWEARTDTPYTVEHYLENLDGNYALDTTEHLKGTTDTTVTAAAKSYDNFTYDSTVPGTVASGNIAGDGSLVLKLFYTRNTYDYTVRHIKQLPDGSYDEANAEVETLSGKFEALAAVTAKDYGEHYPTNDADTKQNIKIEKGLTIDVKYDLDEHTLTFETNGGSAIDPVTVRHGNAVARPADPTKDKYTFIGWYADPEFTEEYDFATVLEADKTIYAKFELTSTPIGDIYVRYDVLHIKQLPDGTYDLANAEVEHLSAKKDTTVTAVIKDYRATHHVNVNRTLSKLTGTAIQPYMGVDGKPVYTILSVYYDLDEHTLTFDTLGGSRVAPVTVRHGLTVAKPADPVYGGFLFDGWYTDKTFRTLYNFASPLTTDTTVYAKWIPIMLPGTTVKKTAPKLNTSDHFAYVQGYPNGTVKPAGNITRAETAAILFRLMDDASRKTYYSTKSGFRDVASGSWYNTYVATLNNASVITDSSNGYFRPNEAITRAELAAMLAKFSETTGAANYFNDVSVKYWAANAIAICAKLGWITGYPDGTFRPDKNVTRAELMAMINRATGRAPKSADAFLPGMKTWIDNTSDKWYYLDVQEATNSHSYTVKGSETWTALTSDPNWSLYE